MVELSIWLEYILMAIALIMCSDVFGWSYKLHSWSIVLRDRAEQEGRRKFNHTIWIKVMLASIMTTGFAIIILFWWAYTIWLDIDDRCLSPWVILSVQITIIHWSAIVARITGMPTSWYPFMSSIVARRISKLDCDCSKK